MSVFTAGCLVDLFGQVSPREDESWLPSLPGQQGLAELLQDLTWGAGQAYSDLLELTGVAVCLNDAAPPSSPPGAHESSSAPLVSVASPRPPSPEPRAPPALCGTLLSLLSPGYFEGSVVVRFTVIESACYLALVAFEGVGLQPSPSTLYSFGASWGPAIAAGGMWRLVAPIFLHASPAHLVQNLFFQLRLGFFVERLMGSRRFGMLYLLSGILGNLISAAIQPWKLAVGASTSVLGVLGAALCYVLMNWENMSEDKRRWAFCIAVILALVLCSTNSDFFGHLGGLVSGVCLMILFSVAPDEGSTFLRVLRCAAATVLVASTGLAANSLHQLSLEHSADFSC